MKQLIALKTEMLIDLDYLNAEIAKAWKSKNMKQVHFYKGKQKVVNHYLKVVNKMIREFEHIH